MTSNTQPPFAAKLRRMSRREFVERSRQEIFKRLDAGLAVFGFNFGGYDFGQHKQTARGASPARFFFEPGQVENLLRLMKARLPVQAEKIIARAEKICAHRFDLLGYEDLDYGPAIDWHLDVVHGKSAPRRPFHQIRYLDFTQVGDSKITWELNRHQHFVTLAKAYRLTGDERFAQEINAQWQSWRAQNPYPTGINWASSLEVGFRSISWIWVHALLAGTAFCTTEFEREYFRMQAISGRHIEHYLSTYFSPNTHLLGEGVALFFLGVMCPNLKRAARWKSQGLQIVLEAAQRQVTPDGLHFEQSTYYHIYALDLFLHAAVLATANRIGLAPAFEQTLERMTNALYRLGAAGPPPRFGDDDGGRLFDPARNRDEHLLDPLALGAILFSREDFKALARHLREETIWLTGEAGVAQWDALDAKAAPLQSSALPESGLHLLAIRDSNSQLMIKGIPSANHMRGHGHADALSLCLQSYGRMLLIDPGTCEYVGQGGERNEYRGTAAHNTLTVDGQNQAEPNGPFSWHGIEVRVNVERWITGESFTLFQGAHDGYARLPHPVTHRRWVVALETGVFLVRDRVEGEGEHHVELSWRLAQDLQMEQDHLFRVKDSSMGLAIIPAGDHVWSEEVFKGTWSPVYGTERRTTVLKFGRTGKLPMEFVTIFVPLAELSVIPGQLLRFRPEGAPDFVHAYRYQTKTAESLFFFSEAEKSLKEKTWSCGPVASDAEFVCLTSESTLHAAGMVLCNGSYLEMEGERVFSASHSVTRWESVNGRISCSHPEAVTASSQSNSEKTVSADEPA